MLALNNIEVVYDGVILVLRGVSLNAEEGHITTLLGAHGAGKTTTLKAISGLLHTARGEATQGSVELDGERSRSDSAAVRASIDRVYDSFPALKERRTQSAGYLSGGEQQMLVIGRALMSEPKVILLDEPSLCLAPMIVEEIFGVIRRLKDEQKITVLLVEQNAALALDIADHGYVMENGRIVLEGPAESLRQLFAAGGSAGASLRAAQWARKLDIGKDHLATRGDIKKGNWRLLVAIAAIPLIYPYLQSPL